MKIHQVSVFLENKPGQLRTACDVLGRARINMVTLSLADTAQFGILRLIVQDWQKARAVLEKAGCVVKITEVLAIEVADKPGGLSQILEIVERAGLNIEYMYAFTEKRGDRAMLVFRFTDPDAAVKVLQDAGINPVGTVELFSRG
ncbi:MAG TPA: ACT domain-containing protein [Verrucomicrobiae bacterium]|nr:ACT domain-containing protein [Verrucomicrobiae bacterium]